MGDKKKDSTTPISDILKTVFQKIESSGIPVKEDVEKVWNEIAGEMAYKHTKIAAFKNNDLTVFVDSSVWMQQLTMQKRQILKGLKRTLGKDKISDIHFKIGEI